MLLMNICFFSGSNKIKMHSHMRESSRLWDYQVLQQLGRGQYGQVFRVRNKKDGLLYALKKVNISSCHQKQKVQAFREVKALKLIKHPDIIQYYESFLSMDNIYIVMEYAARGDLAKVIRQKRLKEKLFSEEQLWNIYTPLANALKYLHQMGIIHRDIKVENIFITEDGSIKIGDLGMSKVIHDPNELISQRVGTPIYFAPQIIQNQLYSYPVDVWAMGCVFYYLATLEHPFKQATLQTLPYFVIDRDPKPIKGSLRGSIINFILGLLTKSAKARPNIFQVSLTIKRRDSKSPANKVHIFDLRKLLMMKPDISQLQQFQKRIQRQGSISQAPKNQRYQSSSGIKTYRDYIKLNLSQEKILPKNDPEELLSPSAKRRHVKNRMPMNLSVYIPSKRLADNKGEPFSPIKTNGFGECKSASLRESQILTNGEGFVRQSRQYGALRQQTRKPAIV